MIAVARIPLTPAQLMRTRVGYNTLSDFGSLTWSKQGSGVHKSFMAKYKLKMTQGEGIPAV